MEEKEYKYMVSVRCFTFNQSKYILDALNGFVMQQTNFPYVVMVVDDASTDGEQEVIRKFVSEQFDTNDTSVAYEKETDYAHITYAQHKTNKNCYIVVLYLKENHYSQRKSKMPYLSEWRDYVKYEAICEGDDYWIHPQKLQMQVDFLEENGEYSMCFHNAITYSEFEKCNIDKFLLPRFSRIYSSKDLYSKGWFVPTASILHRVKLDIIPNDIIKYVNENCYLTGGDILMLLYFSSCGKFWYISENMSVYRFGVQGSATLRASGKKTHEHYLKLLAYTNKRLFNNKYLCFVIYRYVRYFISKLIKKIVK